MTSWSSRSPESALTLPEARPFLCVSHTLASGEMLFWRIPGFPGL